MRPARHVLVAVAAALGTSLAPGAGGGVAIAAAAATATVPAATVGDSDANAIPPRTHGDGPYARLVLKNLTMIDGTGAPATGPVDLVLSGGRIAEIRYTMVPGTVNAQATAAPDRVIDLSGHYAMPGFVDAHAHLHSLADGQQVPPEYVLNLWMAHGVTSVRELGNRQPLEWLVDVRRRSERNEIVAPRINPYPFFHGILGRPVTDPDTAREAVREAKRRGAVGLKFISAQENVLFAALEEASRLQMPTAMHHAQSVVAYANALQTSAHGLRSVEHWYGLPEAMFADRTVQHWPADFVYDDEQMRFAEAGRLWAQTSAPGSERWNALMETLLERGVALDPTFVAYLANRDLMRMIRATWHASYTLPSLWDWYRPSRVNHGSYWFDWTADKEIAWRDNYRRWMSFVNEYKNRGGLVAVGSDCGYLYNLYGFGYVQEMELLQEAGFSPLEVIRAATQSGARLLGQQDEIGTIAVGKKADLVIVKGNPLANLKLLYGTGALVFDEQRGVPVRTEGVAYTVKDGIVYDAGVLRARVRAMVAEQKARRGLPPGDMTVEPAGAMD